MQARLRTRSMQTCFSILQGRFLDTKHGRAGAAPPSLAALVATLLFPQTPQRILGNLVEKHIDGGYFAVTGDEEIGSGILGRLAWRAGHPTDPPRIADLLGRRDRLISKVGMSSLDLAGDAVDFVAAAMRAAVRVVEHTVFVPDLVNRLPPAHRIVLGKHVTKVAKQQVRYIVRHDTSFRLATDSDHPLPVRGRNSFL